MSFIILHKFLDRMIKPDTPFFIRRFTTYFSERFPLLLYLPFVVILYLSLSFLVQVLSENEAFIDYSSIYGIISGFLLMLLVRLFDDIKDEQLDHEIFPKRPVSRGAVLISDVKLLAVITFAILIFINGFFIPRSILIFSIVMIYVLLTFKWFFAKELHIRQPKVAMISHQPLPFAILFLLIHIALASGKTYNAFTQKHLLLLFTFALPITAWEVSRKIKCLQNENKYETFSKIFGFRNAIFLSLTLYSIAGLLSMVLANQLGFAYYFYIVIALSLVFLYYHFFRFLNNPLPENNNLQRIAMIFTGVLLVSIIIFFLLKFTIKILL